MSQENLRDEEAFSTEEINRLKTEKKKLIKKTLSILVITSLIIGIGYLLSLVNWKKIINDRKKKKQAKVVVVDPKLSPHFNDGF